MKVLIRVILIIILFVAAFLFIYLFVLKKKINKEEIKYQIEEFKKSRALMGTLSIVIALILCFVVTPAFTAALKGRITVLEATKDIKAGEMITSQMLRKVEIGSYNLSSDIIINENELKNRYATTQILKGQYFYKSAISDNIPYDDEYLYTNLTGANRAISFTVRNLSYGLSNKLIKGDIISLIIVDTQTKIEAEQAVIPEELKYIEILSTTNDNGKDIDKIDPKEDDDKIYQTITALVSDEQAKLIARAEATKQIYVELVYRGNKKITSYLLNKQREILNVIYPERVNDQTINDIKELLVENQEQEIETETEESTYKFETISFDIDELKNAISANEVIESSENVKEINESNESKTSEAKKVEGAIETKSIEEIQKDEYERIAAEFNLK